MRIKRRDFLGMLGAGAVSSMTRPLMAATPADMGIDAQTKTVTIGAFTPITGPVPFYSVLTHAAQAYFKHRNDHGGINGWKVNFITYDDGYEPGRSVAVARRLVEENHVFSLVASVGTAQNTAVIPYAKEVGLPMIGPIGGASAFFSERLVFPLLPDYGWSASSNADYARQTLKLSRIALLWENDELGRSAKHGIDEYMASRKLDLVASIPFEVSTTDFSAHIRRVANANTEAVILFGSNANLASALKAAQRFQVQAKWFAPFFTADPTTVSLAGPLLEGVYFSSWLLPVSSVDAEVSAYREAIKRYFPSDPVGVFGLNGWSNAALFGIGFKKLLESGRPLTREDFVAVMETLRNEAVGAARNVSFMPGDHRGTRQEAIIEASGSQFKLVRDFQPYPQDVFNSGRPA